MVNLSSKSWHYLIPMPLGRNPFCLFVFDATEEMGKTSRHFGWDYLEFFCVLFSEYPWHSTRQK
jgi:hypothetical protein